MWYFYDNDRSKHWPRSKGRLRFRQAEKWRKLCFFQRGKEKLLEEQKDKEDAVIKDLNGNRFGRPRKVGLGIIVSRYLQNIMNEVEIILFVMIKNIIASRRIRIKWKMK